MTRTSVTIEGVGKKFGLQLRAALKYGLIDSFRRMTGRGKDSILRSGEFWALQDVNALLEPGDALGIMGVNGSGKTTLLRILNGTYSPDAGKVTLRGRIGALIAAGAGFSPMLSGRENVFINGTLLGMTPQEIRAKFDEIVAFADLDKFIDMPVRNYSSGMNVRLGFAIAVLGQPDILLVDEVLAVGDISFQKKCYERIFALRNEGVTILLVSHSPGAIWAVCNKGLFLHKGISPGVNDVETTCKLYEEQNSHSTQAAQAKTIENNYGSRVCGTGTCFVEDFQVLNADGTQVITEVERGESFLLSFTARFAEPVGDLIARIAIDSEIYKAIAIIDSYEAHSRCYSVHNGSYNIRVLIKNPHLRPGCYSLTVSLQSKAVGVHLFLEHNISSIVVKQQNKEFLYADFRSVLHVESEFALQPKG